MVRALAVKTVTSEGRTADFVEARYANYFELGHTGQEFVLLCGQNYEDDEPIIHTRVVTSPAYAKELAALLLQAIAEYEAEYGAIPEDRGKSSG